MSAASRAKKNPHSLPKRRGVFIRGVYLHCTEAPKGSVCFKWWLTYDLGVSWSTVSSVKRYLKKVHRSVKQRGGYWTKSSVTWLRGKQSSPQKNLRVSNRYNMVMGRKAWPGPQWRPVLFGQIWWHIFKAILSNQTDSYLSSLWLESFIFTSSHNKREAKPASLTLPLKSSSETAMCLKAPKRCLG